MFSINLKKGQKQREHTTKGNGDLSEEVAGLGPQGPGDNKIR